MSRERLGGTGAPEPESRVGSAPSLASSLKEALSGAVFPLTAEELAWVARENEAPAPLLTRLGALPRGRFESVEAVARALEHAATP
ncbi:DUF2795 domain-containing protein [Myxococcaceae bacterium JPH2]|nr:DUF2795 domain-containing protein [Myxococcaceae bacterium JPH2]